MKTKIPTAKLDDELEKDWKQMEDISITKGRPKVKTTDTTGRKYLRDRPYLRISLAGNKTLVKLIVQGDKVTAKPIMQRPKIKQGLIPGEGK